jgi:tetratricopeptide (TPR) repeat protein
MKLLVLFGIFSATLWGSVILTKESTPLPQDISASEDMLIVKAILSEDDGNYTASRDTFEKLFTLTGNKEYLIREAQDALAQKKDIKHSVANLTHWVTKHPMDHDKKLYLILAALYIQTNSLAEADEIVDAYLTNGNVDVMDLQEFGALKIQLGEHEEALRLFKRAYELSPDEDTALQLSMLYLSKLNKPDKAITVLQRYLDSNPSASIGIYFKLIELYAKGYHLDKVVELYKKLYLKDPQQYFMQKIIEISLYKKDLDGLIKFLEKTQGNEELLYDVCKSNALYEKAISLAKNLYIKTSKPKWLAEEAILLYEKARKEQNITPELLKKISRLFDSAIIKVNNKGTYLNYYGYTLIDHDMDIDKGIGLIRRALGRDPNNPFFMDSLAWGLYKKGQCKNSYKLMLRVVKKLGLKEQEIKDHYRAAKACSSRKKKRRR